MGMRGHEGRGCILADEMYVVSQVVCGLKVTQSSCRGMGKTLQVGTLIILLTDH